MDAGNIALRPGAIVPEPLQRGFNEIEEMPTRDIPCPACGHAVTVPLVDKLMRSRPGLAGGDLKWQMHAARRDADLAPYPGKNKLSYQADIAACPDCGFAAPADDFDRPLPPETRKWARDVLRQNMRRAETALLGKRAADMSEEEIIAFFNRQEDIPDSVRTEHYRIFVMAGHFPKLRQAEATWLAAWALRRESAGRPRGDFLAKRTEAVEAAAAKLKIPPAGALRHLLGRARSGRERLNYGDRMAARLLLAGEDIRRGLCRKAFDQLDEMRRECGERFLKPEQDPFWSSTNTRASRTYRLNELETIRTEVETELAVRMEQVRRESELLGQAATLLREAILAGECAGRDDALFHAYLTGEFLRRRGELPLSAEWFKNVQNLAAADSPMAKAVAERLAVLAEQAGDDVNLLSGLGHDREFFEKLRELCLRENAVNLSGGNVQTLSGGEP